MDLLDKERLAPLYARELARFHARIPKSMAAREVARRFMPDGVPMSWMSAFFSHPPVFVDGGEGSVFRDIDGNEFVDFNLADLSNTVGYGKNAVSRALADCAARGIQYLQPSMDAINVSAALAARTGMPFWQYTGTASAANIEAIRIARAYTRRDKVVLFTGKYHGHIDTTLAKGGSPEGNEPARPSSMGVSARATADAVNVAFNDLDHLKAALGKGDVALVLIEPALTNCSLVLPDPGFLEGAFELTSAAGALFALDETHTLQMAYGGLIGERGLKADILTLGKGFGAGVSLGAYGLTPKLARFIDQHQDSDTVPEPGIALGGTTYGNALSMAGARAMLDEVATPEAHTRIAKLGARLADGLDAIIAKYDLPWRAFRYGPRSGFCLTPSLPRTYVQALRSVHADFYNLRHTYLANRGIWDAIVSAGPQVSFAHTEQDVDCYIEVCAELIDEIATG
ncbi:aminotransferase class III-fold pyridoxal phosphate-dependent enzyme [Ruegeria sp. WL0004]|uniref:Aminotransferase class III-fold pyridoxal phosphate-dependent enzyme n=1 Tax=Ruegeria marisflavi TaxID=2984152 RepID=A0ABT2WU82_9RHOB|nr:aminotransferase class III-fold pyridoxal phosphate-dependent enzyme [Ruegeria sp. WL0004]MCU9839459.1 aminotransferase class III-fold pyridoxal phosphate-dependent enzyme [Ruegeria sp. WL0004]